MKNQEQISETLTKNVLTESEFRVNINSVIPIQIFLMYLPLISFTITMYNAIDCKGRQENIGIH